MSRVLTADDLDALGADAMAAADPRPIRAEILAAVDGDRIADPDEIPYALALAAEISERCNDEAEALALSARAADAAEGRPGHAPMRSTHADVLLRFGHGDEGMRVLEELRPALTRDPGAAEYVADPLAANGRPELAEQWLTAALLTATEAAERREPSSEEALDAWEVVDALAVRRRDLRHELGLPPDEHDHEADALDEGPDAIFWVEELLATVLTAAPDAGDVEGLTFDEHRARLERALQEDPDLVVEVGTPQMADALVAGDLAGTVPGPVLAWPPGRNDPCWCRSGVKYKKCCLPRARP